MIVYKAFIVHDARYPSGWWKYPRWGAGYKTIKGLIRNFYRPLADYALIEIWRFHEGTPTRDGGVPWFVPELIEVYIYGVKQ